MPIHPLRHEVTATNDETTSTPHNHSSARGNRGEEAAVVFGIGILRAPVGESPVEVPAGDPTLVDADAVSTTTTTICQTGRRKPNRVLFWTPILISPKRRTGWQPVEPSKRKLKWSKNATVWNKRKQRRKKKGSSGARSSRHSKLPWRRFNRKKMTKSSLLYKPPHSIPNQTFGSYSDPQHRIPQRPTGPWTPEILPAAPRAPVLVSVTVVPEPVGYERVAVAINTNVGGGDTDGKGGDGTEGETSVRWPVADVRTAVKR
jgi:hypothetical protein